MRKLKLRSINLLKKMSLKNLILILIIQIFVLSYFFLFDENKLPQIIDKTKKVISINNEMNNVLQINKSDSNDLKKLYKYLKNNKFLNVKIRKKDNKVYISLSVYDDDNFWLLIKYINKKHSIFINNFSIKRLIENSSDEVLLNAIIEIKKLNI